MTDNFPGDSWGPKAVKRPDAEETQQALSSLHDRKSRRDRNVRIAGASGVAVAVLLVASAVFLQTDNTKNVVATTSPSTVVKQAKATSTTVATTTTTLPPRENTYVATIKGLEQIDASGKQTVLVPTGRFDYGLPQEGSSIEAIVADPINGRVWFSAGMYGDCTSKLFYYDLDGKRFVEVGAFYGVDFALNSSATEIAIAEQTCEQANQFTGNVSTLSVKRGTKTVWSDSKAHKVLDAKVFGSSKKYTVVTAITYDNNDKLVVASATGDVGAELTSLPTYVVDTKKSYSSLDGARQIKLGSGKTVVGMVALPNNQFVITQEINTSANPDSFRTLHIRVTDTAGNITTTIYRGSRSKYPVLGGLNENTGRVFFFVSDSDTEGLPQETVYSWLDGKTRILAQDSTAADQ